MPAALVIGTVGAAALTRRNFSRDEIPDYGIYWTLHSKEYLDIILAEQVHCPRTHAAGKDMGYLMTGEKYGKFPGFVPGACQDLLFGDLLILNAEHGIFSAMSEMCGDCVPFFCNCDFHDNSKNPGALYPVVAPSATKDMPSFASARDATAPCTQKGGIWLILLFSCRVCAVWRLHRGRYDIRMRRSRPASPASPPGVLPRSTGTGSIQSWHMTSLPVPLLVPYLLICA